MRLWLWLRLLPPPPAAEDGVEARVRRTVAAETAAVAALRPLLGLALAAERVLLFDLGAAFNFGMMGNTQYVCIDAVWPCAMYI